MKLLSVLHVSPKKVGDDKKPSPVHKSWENANIAQLACDEAKGWEACKDIVADGKWPRQGARKNAFPVYPLITTCFRAASSPHQMLALVVSARHSST